MDIKENSAVLEAIGQREKWIDFLNYKSEKGHLNQYELKLFQEYIRDERYLVAYEQIKAGIFPNEYAAKKMVNKSCTKKKRVVYSYSDEINIALKFIAHHLYIYDDRLEKNCYAFRKNYGVGQALRRLVHNANVANMYCYKVDIQDYFNSIDVKILLEKLDFVREDDEKLYSVFQNILMQKHVKFNGHVIVEEHGAMAGIPIAPFLANIYLKKADAFFARNNVVYFRYSDDILIFANSLDELEK